jgi:hypothetical protein
MNDITDCLQAVERMLDVRGLAPGGFTHAFTQIQVAVAERLAHSQVAIEQKIQGQLGGEEFTRQVDLVVQRAGEDFSRHIEFKMGGEISTALNEWQLLKDAALGATGEVRNEWHLLGVQLDKDTQSVIADYLDDVRTQLGDSLGPDEIRTALESFRFVDKFGSAIKAVVDESGEIVFEPAMDTLLGEGGTLQRVATEKAENSPDFGPAMEILLGAGGKLADAAQNAAAAADLDPAFVNLEEEIEQGVTQAMDEAGDAAAGHGAVALGTKLGEGAKALGDVFTAVPQLYNSVSELGAAWDKPLSSTKDYMDLFSKLGGVLGQGVDTIQKLAGVTKIASAAQAVFNAIMALNPIVLVVLAVLALIAVIVALIAYWDEVKAALRDNPWLAVVAALFGVIGVIVVVIAYWEEIKLAVLEAANFISIQAKRIGLFFMGVGNLIKQVWDWIVDSLYNAGVGILNTFSEFGAWILNLFIGIANGVIDLYNDTVAYIPGVDEIERISEVEATKFETRPVQEISVEAAFAPAMGPISGGLEEQITAQRSAVAAADEEDRARRARDAEAEERERRAREAERPALGAPGAPAGILAGRPGLPEGAAAAGGVDQSVRVEGGITVNINAERLEADTARLLSDEIVRRLKERLDALRSEQEFRAGVRSPAPALSGR